LAAVAVVVTTHWKQVLGFSNTANLQRDKSDLDNV
jgi:hypothetical protein